MARTSMKTVMSGGDKLHIVTNYAGNKYSFRSKRAANATYNASKRVAAKRRAWRARNK